jgi:hypothetical protein
MLHKISCFEDVKFYLLVVLKMSKFESMFKSCSALVVILFLLRI